MKPSERIAQIASDRYRQSVGARGMVDNPDGEFANPFDPRAIVAYLDELQAENEALRALVAELVPKPPGYTLVQNSVLIKKARD
jgi:hypothetical protein